MDHTNVETDRRQPSDGWVKTFEGKPSRSFGLDTGLIIYTRASLVAVLGSGGWFGGCFGLFSWLFSWLFWAALGCFGGCFGVCVCVN